MAELSTLARPYAKAAFEYAKEHNAINEWEDFLPAASSIVVNEEFASLLNNPAISATQKATILMDIYQSHTSMGSILAKSLNYVASHGVDVSGVAQALSGINKPSVALSNFTTQLSEHDRLVLLPEIYAHYSKLKSQELKQVDAYITSAYPLTDAQRKDLQQRLAISTNSIVILHEAVDPELLGGATIKVGDKFTDGSVRGKLQQLKNQLSA